MTVQAAARNTLKPWKWSKQHHKGGRRQQKKRIDQLEKSAEPGTKEKEGRNNKLRSEVSIPAPKTGGLPKKRRAVDRRISRLEEISRLRRHCRKLFIGAKKNGDWDNYKSALTKYNKAIRDTKRNSWRKLCDEIGDVFTMGRVMKFMARDRSSRLNTIKLSNSSFTNSRG